MRVFLWQVMRDECGQGLAEYALILTLVAVVAAVTFALVGLTARELYDGLLPFPG